MSTLRSGVRAAKRLLVMRRGIPLRLYVDNGSAFRSHHLALVCARLGMTLIHARPCQPQGKGKQERFFRTVRMQLLPTLGEDDFTNLDALNRRLWAWIEGEYHRRPQRGSTARRRSTRGPCAPAMYASPGPSTICASSFSSRTNAKSTRTAR